LVRYIWTPYQIFYTFQKYTYCFEDYNQWYTNHIILIKNSFDNLKYFPGMFFIYIIEYCPFCNKFSNMHIIMMKTLSTHNYFDYEESYIIQNNNPNSKFYMFRWHIRLSLFKMFEWMRINWIWYYKISSFIHNEVIKYNSNIHWINL